MLLGSGVDVVVQVVDDQGGALRWQSNVELEEKRGDGRGDRLFRGQGQQDVAVLVDIVDEDGGSQVGAEAFGLGREEDEVVVSELAVLEEGEGGRLGRFEREGEAASYAEGQLVVFGGYNVQSSRAKHTLKVAPEVRVVGLLRVVLKHHQQTAASRAQCLHCAQKGKQQ